MSGLIRLEIQITTPNPDPLSVKLQHDNNREDSHTYRSLGTEGSFSTDASNPLDLNVTDNKPTCCPREVHSHANFSTGLWVRVQQVHVDAGGIEQDPERV